MPFTLLFNNDKTKLHALQTFSLNQDIIQVYDQFLRNILFQNPNETDPFYAQFSHQSSFVGQIFSQFETSEKTTVSTLNSFPQNDPVSHLQIDLDLFTVIFRSVLDQFSLVDDPDTSQLLTFAHFFQYCFKNYYFLQAIPAI